MNLFVFASFMLPFGAMGADDSKSNNNNVSTIVQSQPQQQRSLVQSMPQRNKRVQRNNHIKVPLKKQEPSLDFDVTKKIVQAPKGLVNNAATGFKKAVEDLDVDKLETSVNNFAHNATKQGLKMVEDKATELAETENPLGAVFDGVKNLFGFGAVNNPNDAIQTIPARGQRQQNRLLLEDHPEIDKQLVVQISLSKSEVIDMAGISPVDNANIVAIVDKKAADVMVKKGWCQAEKAEFRLAFDFAAKMRTGAINPIDMMKDHRLGIVTYQGGEDCAGIVIQLGSPTKDQKKSDDEEDDQKPAIHGKMLDDVNANVLTDPYDTFLLKDADVVNNIKTVDKKNFAQCLLLPSPSGNSKDSSSNNGKDEKDEGGDKAAKVKKVEVVEIQLKEISQQQLDQSSKNSNEQQDPNQPSPQQQPPPVLPVPAVTNTPKIPGLGIELSRKNMFITAAVIGVPTVCYGARKTYVGFKNRFVKPSVVNNTTRLGFGAVVNQRVKSLFGLCGSVPAAKKSVFICNDAVAVKVNDTVDLFKRIKKGNDNLPCVLLTGASGTGKKTLAKKLAQTMGLDFAAVSGVALNELAPEGMASTLQELFQWASGSSKGTLLFINNAEKIIGDRRSLGSGKAELLEKFVEMISAKSKDFTIVFSTERLEKVDKLAKRHMSKTIELALPKVPELCQLMEHGMERLIVNSKKYRTLDMGCMTPAFMQELATTFEKEQLTGREIMNFVKALRYVASHQTDIVLTEELVKQVMHEFIATNKSQKASQEANA